MATVLTILALVSILLAQHPYITFPLSLFVISKFRKQPLGSKRSLTEEIVSADKINQPKLAILLCVHNEESIIQARIENLLALTSSMPNTEILIYSDGSTDKTVDILNSFDNRITLLDATDRLGKTYGMNALVELASAELLVFTDAAVIMNSDALTNIVSHFDDPAIGCVCGHIIARNTLTENKHNQSLTSTSHTSIKYWAFDATIRRLETRVASVIGAHGPLFAIRRKLHEAAPEELIDDLYLSLAILFKGYRVVQAENVVGLKAVATTRQDEYERKVRIACQAFNVHKTMRYRLKKQPVVIRYLYAGHKTLRWLTVFSLLAASIFGTLAFTSAGSILFPILLWSTLAIFILLGYLSIKPFDRLLDALLPFIANGEGVIKSLRGKTYQTWSSAASAR